MVADVNGSLASDEGNLRTTISVRCSVVCSTSSALRRLLLVYFETGGQADPETRAANRGRTGHISNFFTRRRQGISVLPCRCRSAGFQIGPEALVRPYIHREGALRVMIRYSVPSEEVSVAEEMSWST